MDRLSTAVLALLLLSTPSMAFEKVIGGRDTNSLKHPWQVALHTKYSGHLCGASLVSKRLILTAAHCVDTFGARDLRIKAASKSGEMRALKKLPRVKEVIIHPGFDPDNLASDDIAIIVLKRDVQFTESLKPINVIRENTNGLLLETDFRDLPGRMMSSGWGTKKSPSRFPIHSKVLQ